MHDPKAKFYASESEWRIERGVLGKAVCMEREIFVNLKLKVKKKKKKRYTNSTYYYNLPAPVKVKLQPHTAHKSFYPKGKSKKHAQLAKRKIQKNIPALFTRLRFLFSSVALQDLANNGVGSIPKLIRRLGVQSRQNIQKY
jgi:hypothetical protein